MKKDDEASDRFVRGLDKLREIDGEAGEKFLDEYEDLAPDMARYAIEFAFGDIYSREGLETETRELITIAALTMLGATAREELKLHIEGARNLGIPRDKIVETIMHTTIFGGFPRALHAMSLAKEILEEDDADPPE